MAMLGISKQAVFTVPFVLSEATGAEFERAWAGAPAPFKVLHLACRGRYRRLTERALGAAPVPQRILEMAS
jgi:hypothetical protein